MNKEQENQNHIFEVLHNPFLLCFCHSLSSKIQLMRSLVTFIFLYACESCTLTAEPQRRIQAMEMRCCRKILHISYKRPCYQRRSPCQDPTGNRTTRRPPDHRKKAQTAMVWSCLPFIRSGQNHLERHSESGKKQGRQRNKWEDNIGEWTGLECAKSQRAVENREIWKTLFAKSSVVPQRPSRLRDK